MTIRLKTNMKVEECVFKLNNAIDSRPFSLLFSPVEVVGKVRGEKFYLNKRTLHFTNSFNRVFYGQIRKDDNGSVIEGSFKIILYIKISMAIYFLGVIAIGCFLLLALYSGNGSNIIGAELILGLIIAILMLLFGIIICRHGLKLSLKEEEYLIMFLEQTLNAQKID